MFLIIMSLLVAACGDNSSPTGPAGGPARVKITVAPGSPSVVSFIHYWIAEPLGFYAAENLDVEVIAQIEGGLVQQAITTDRLDFGGVTADTLLAQAVKGPPDFKLFMHDTLWTDFLFVLKDSPYQTAADLKGKIIGIPEAKDEAVAEVLMAAAGVPKGQYQTLVTGNRAPAAVAMKQGKTQAFAGTRTDEYAMNGANIPVRKIPTGNTALLYNSGVAAPLDTLKNNPQLAVRFGRALAKAWVWAQTNPESAVEQLKKVAPEAVSDEKTTLALLKAANEGTRTLYEAKGRGEASVWAQTIDMYVKFGSLEKSYDPDTTFTNDLIDQIWDFDIEAVKTAARDNKVPGS